MRNRLASTTSPYLLQHQDNPVHWQPWDDEALAAAQELDKPILLSIGYAACHWCHVMAHESFESDEIAALMNRDFVNIKVDREERPDLDQIYQHALALLGQQGWLAFDHVPDSRMASRSGAAPTSHPSPAMAGPVCRKFWRASARSGATSGTRSPATRRPWATRSFSSPLPKLADPLGDQMLFRAANQLAQAFDTIHGGLSGAPKFPQAPLLDFLWRQARASGDATMRHAVLHTLTNICQGGIYDHLGGGFRPLFGRCAVAGAAFREDALRQCPAPGSAGRRGGRHEKPTCSPRAPPRRSAGSNGRCWSKMPSPPVSTPTARARKANSMSGRPRSSTKFSVRTPLPSALAYGVTDGGNWEGNTVLNRLHQQSLLELRARGEASRRPLIACCQPERSVSGRDATIRCWLIGTA